MWRKWLGVRGGFRAVRTLTLKGNFEKVCETDCQYPPTCIT